MAPSRIEVSQEGAVPDITVLALLFESIPLGFDVIGDDVFDCRFGPAIGVGGANGAAFGNGYHVWEASGIAVDGGGGGEDDVGDIVFCHGGEEADGAVDVGAVVLEGDFSRFADCLYSTEYLDETRILFTNLEGSKMDDIVDIRVIGEDFIKGIGDGDVDVVESRTFAADQLDAVDAFLRRIV